MKLKILQQDPIDCPYPIYRESYRNICNVLEPYNLTLENNWKEIGYREVFDGEWDGLHCIADLFLISVDMKADDLPSGHHGTPTNIADLIYLYPSADLLHFPYFNDEPGWYFVDEDGSRRIELNYNMNGE